MKKPAKNKYDIHPLIRERWSPRAFDSREVETDKLRSILEAARWSPSSFNHQPWSFIVGTKNSDAYKKIMDTLVDFNKSWAKLAPVLIMTVGKKNDSQGNPNTVFKYDVGQSVAFMTMQAMQEGLFVHQMGGFSKSKAREIFSIDENFEPLTCIAVGYMGEVDKLPKDLQKGEKAERKRNEFEEFVFEQKFGDKSSLL